MRIIILFIIGLTLYNCAHHDTQPMVDNITVEELYEHVAFLASDSLKGRKPGTPEGDLAAAYIRDQIKKSGLQLLGDNGFQYFDVVTDVEPGPVNSLTINDFTAKINEDYIPLAFSKDTSAQAEVVFVDYGFDFDDDSVAWHSYKNLDVKGKYVLILRGDPDPERGNSVFESYNSLRHKVLKAKDQGVLGLLFVSGKNIDPDDALIEMTVNDGRTSAGVQVIHIKRAVADKLLEKQNVTIEALEKEINENRQPKSIQLNQVISLSTQIIKKTARTQNVVGLLPGNDAFLKNEYIVIGAHYDHLGMGGTGSGSRRPDTMAVHNGADDNASGVASIIEIVEKIASMKNENKRSLIFIAFGAEEMGLLGSKFFTDHPLIDIKNVKTMFNLDMVGSLNKETKALTVGGTGTAVGLSDLVTQLVDTTKLVLKQSTEGYGPSDHASFYMKDIPVLFFFTGVTQEYHTPDDIVDSLNFAGQKIVSDYVYNLAMTIDNRSEALVFQEAGPKAPMESGRRSLKVTLGIMPDFASANTKGLRADMVIKDKPAYRAGMQNGDIIVAMDGKPVADIYEYMA
ncbi:MAG TPA: M20/M25/M40 family metallo-hydrolase, partial [Caldithrix sp.]|nr:M20/M25/M40 family metallo-hydrolase [Caldithrix sp.]